MTSTTLSGSLVAGASRAPGFLDVVDELLRDRDAFLARLERGEDAAAVVRALILAVAAGGAAFGAALGVGHGALQLALAAVKLPVACLATAAICTPVLTTMRHVLLGPSSLRRDIGVVLASLVSAMLVTSALTPVVLLAKCVGAHYHAIVVLAVACGGCGAASGISFFLHSLRGVDLEPRMLVVSTVLTTFALVGLQSVWTLRPYVSAPHAPAAIVRPIEGNFVDAFIRSADRITGDDDAPIPGATR